MIAASPGWEKFLRRTSIDELPQLFNVLMGTMSLVGPRPHALGSRAEGSLFWELVPDYWSRHAVKPGLTGLAQIRGLRGATESRRDIEARVAADLEYINNWSLWLDVSILILTARVIIHRNAH
ncbi:sugar transferase [Ancylobacter dichloromethanicus]